MQHSEILTKWNLINANRHVVLMYQSEEPSMTSYMQIYHVIIFHLLRYLSLKINSDNDFLARVWNIETNNKDQKNPLVWKDQRQMLWLTNTCTRVLCKVMTVGQIVLSLVKHKKKQPGNQFICVFCSLKQYIYELHFHPDFFLRTFYFSTEMTKYSGFLISVSHNICGKDF